MWDLTIWDYSRGSSICQQQSILLVAKVWSVQLAGLDIVFVASITREQAKASQPIAAKVAEERHREGTVKAKTLPLPPGSLELPVVLGVRQGRQEDRELLPRILSDEIAFRSALLGHVETAERALLNAIDRQLYSIDKASLPAIANSLAKLVELSERIVERTKGIAVPKQGEQVSGLYAKYALLQKALRDRGLVDGEGKLRNTAQRIAAIDVQVGEPGVGDGGIVTGSLSGGGSCDSPSASSPPPSAPEGVSAQGPMQESQDDQGVITEPLRAEDLPLGPPSALDGPKRYRRLNKIRVD
jgi:hypothetical protein